MAESTPVVVEETTIQAEPTVTQAVPAPLKEPLASDDVVGAAVLWVRVAHTTPEDLAFAEVLRVALTAAGISV